MSTDKMREALVMARAGLVWYQENYPQTFSECDNEALEQIDAALSQSEPQVSQPMDQQLLDFYNVKTANELITIQKYHIKRLQEKLAETDSKNIFRPTFPRG